MANHPTRRTFVSGAATGLLVPLGQASAASKSAGAEPFVQTVAGAITRTVEDKLRDIISVKDFGAIGDGVADDTAAFQAAINEHSAGRNPLISIYVPPGTYRLTDTIRINRDFVTVYGAGDRSLLHFDPVADNKVMLLVQNADRTQIIKNIFIRDIGIRASYPSALKKTAIKIIDGNNLTLSGVRIVDYSWAGGSGGGSIGLHLCGRDTHRLRDLTLIADRPIYVDKNPNSNYYTFDFHHWSEVSMVTRNPSQYAVTFAPGVNPSNWLVDGNCGAFQGKGGIFLNNQGARTETPSMIAIRHFRCESGTGSGGGAGGYGIYMDFGTGNPACGNISIEECSVNDPTCNGYYLKGVSALTVRNVNCGFGPANNAFILTDVGSAQITNLGIGHALATVTLTNMFAQRLHKFPGASPTSKSIGFGQYLGHAADSPANNLVYENGVRKWSRTQSLANGETMSLPGLAAGGSMLVFASCGLGGAVYAAIYNNSFLLHATPGWEAAIAVVSDGAGNSRLINRSAGTQNFVVSTDGT